MVNVVLFQPENPFNTGAAIRTCVLLGAALHLIQPYGFSGLDDDVRRASMSYINAASPVEHRSWSEFLDVITASDPRIFALWDEGTALHTEAVFLSGDFLVFGQESVGLPPDITSRVPTLRIDMPGVVGTARTDHRDHSLNLSVSIGIVVAEANRQLHFR